MLSMVLIVYLPGYPRATAGQEKARPVTTGMITGRGVGGLGGRVRSGSTESTLVTVTVTTGVKIQQN